ncbi:MAG: hypothetical protein M3N42_02610 [Cyanobacteriota bacterium]|nr:hypothetical protein [Cyanobacteriota bacterium]
MNIEDTCHRFFCAERTLVWGYRSDCVGSGIEGKQRVGFDRAIGCSRPKTDTSFLQES